MILCLCTLDYYSGNTSVAYLQLGLIISSYFAVHSFPNAVLKHFGFALKSSSGQVNCPIQSEDFAGCWLV